HPVGFDVGLIVVAVVGALPAVLVGLDVGLIVVAVVGALPAVLVGLDLGLLVVALALIGAAMPVRLDVRLAGVVAVGALAEMLGLVHLGAPPALWSGTLRTRRGSPPKSSHDLRPAPNPTKKRPRHRSWRGPCSQESS